MRPRHGRESGAETLEFTAVAALLLVVFMLCARAIEYVEMELRAQDDARSLARDAAVCERAGSALNLASVDPQAPIGSSTATTQPRHGLVAVTVTLPAFEIMPNMSATDVVPRATVTMRKEPGCP